MAPKGIWEGFILCAGLLVSCSSLAGNARPSVPLARIYKPEPAQTLWHMGFYSTGAALVDLDRDGWPELVLSNGNDLSPQPLVVYSHQKTSTPPVFTQSPNWYSGDFDYQGGLAVGDINGDGWLDVAVAVLFDRYRTPDSGHIKVYLNREGRLEDTPSYVTDSGFTPGGCTLADLDADGDLDLAVAVFHEAGPGAPGAGGAQQRIYLNQGGRLAPTPGWKSHTPLVSPEVVAADVNQDGWMDLVFAAERASIFHGHAPEGGEVPLPHEPQWVAERAAHLEGTVEYGLDVGRVGDGQGLAIATARNCHGSPSCRTGFFLYQPERGSQPVWSYERTANSSKLLLADVNADGYLDLLTSQMGVQFAGAPFLFFQGTASGFGTKPAYRTRASPSIGQSLAVANLRRLHPETRHVRFVPASRRAVVTLEDRRLDALIGVRLDGVTLEPSRYAWVPGQNWISLARPLEPGQVLEVDYVRSPVVDVFTASASPHLGNFLLFSDYAPPLPAVSPP